MPFEIDFLTVGDGNGDAICVRYGNPLSGYTTHLVDGGFSGTSKTIIEHIEKYYDTSLIDNVVLSHADNDHAMGLIDVFEHFDIGALWMNRPWLYASEVLDQFHGGYTLQGLVDRMKELHPYLVEMEQIAERKEILIYPAFQGSTIGEFQVLAPTRDRYVSLIHELDKTPTSYAEEATKSIGRIITDAVKAAKDWVLETWGTETLGDNLSTSASNESCIVQIANFEGNKVVLTADVGPIGLAEAADYAQTLGLLSPPRFIQVPHHGSRHNVSKTTLNRWLGMPVPDETTKRGNAFVSIGTKKSDYPRRAVSNAFLRRGYPVYPTRTGSVRHSQDMPSRNWGAATAEPFHAQVEE